MVLKRYDNVVQRKRDESIIEEVVGDAGFFIQT
jgi:hypothetical protein